MSVNIVNFSEARKNFKSVKINGQIGKEVIGKIDETSNVYQSCKTLRNTIQIPRNNEYILPAIF